MKKSMFRWMLVLNVLLAILLLAAQAATGEVIDSGYCGYDYGENVTWTLYSDGTLVLDGTGRTDYYGGYYFRGDAPWTEYADEIKTICVEGGVTELSAGLFDTCSSATELILVTDTVTKIHSDAFPNNSVLECITAEYEGGTYLAIDGVLYGPDYIPDTWEETLSLVYYPPQKQDKEFYLPFGLEMVSSFGGNDYLEVVHLNEDLKYIGSSAFRGCTSLSRIDNMQGVTTIDICAFEACGNLKELELPSTLKTLDVSAFWSCDLLDEITVPESVEVFGCGVTSGGFSIPDEMDSKAFYFTGDAPSGFLEDLEYGHSELSFKGNEPDLMYTDIYYPSDAAGWTEQIERYEQYIAERDYEPSIRFYSYSFKEEIASGYCGGEGDGTNLTWTLYKDGELIISGIGKMADYANYTKTPWYEKRSSIKTITIEDGVTTIGDNAFHICWSLTQLNIANSVTSIGESAFHNCYSLKSVEIPEGVTTIGEGAFEMCFGLTTVSLPDSLMTIEDIAFMSCDKLESVHIPAGVTSIGRAFDGCAGLMEITVDDANTAYSSKGGVLFNKAQTVLVCCPGKKNGHYTIPDGVTTIREHAFSNCTKLTSVTIPNGVATIGDYAFWCVGLNQITIPTSVTTIGNRAFYTSSLTRMEFLGNAPTTIGSNAFDCDNLTIYYHEGTTGWTDSEYYDAEAGTWCGRPLVKILASGYCGGEGDGTNLTWTLYEDGELVIEGTGAMGNWAYFATGMGDDILPWEDHWYLAKKVTIHDGVTTIGSGAFCRNDNLTTVTIPDSVTAIGDGAFYDCDGLSEVDIPDSVTSIGTATFCDCSALESVQLPDGVTTLSEMVFAACENLADVAIPADVRVIEREAFSGCTNLLAVTIPAGVTTIGEYAFSDCTDLNVLVFEGDAPKFYERREDDTSRFSIYCFTEKNGWTDSEHYDAETGMWYGNPLVELFNRRGLAVWLTETYLDPDMQIDLSKSYFTDVDVTDKNFREIMLCSYLGLFAGSDGKFNPDGTVNRAQMATVLVKVYNGSEFNADSFKGQSHFSDTADFEGGWAEGYINWAFQQGLMKAYDEMAADFFMPNITTRKIDIMTVGMKHVVMAGQAENGTVSIDKTYGAEGETVTVTAVPDTGYQLRKILVSGKAIDGNTFTITGNHFVTALFGIVASITTDSVADATQHVPYSAMIQTDHWDDSMSFELASGKLPAGLKLKKSGELYGVPSQAGTFTFTVNAVYSDDGTVVDSKAFSLTVLEDIPENIEDVNKGPEGYEVKEHIGTPVTNDQGETHYEIDVKKVKEEDLVFVSEGEFDEFVDVYLDGRKLIRDEEYTVEEGSTKITIRAQTFKSAGNGQHVIAAEFRAGETLKKTAQSVTVSGVKTASLGGGSVSTVKQYKITVEPNANGTITCTRTTAREKEVVVITVQPAAGYIVKSVSAGSGVKVSTHSGNEYKFTMPASDVTISVVFEAELPFGDVAAEGTFYEAVKFVYENGIMVGTGENNFAPDAKLSRAMVVQVLYNYEKQPEVTVSTDFTDVPEGQWYTSAVRWATDKGVVAGYGDGTFGTDDDVTIEQVAVILWNYAGQPMAEGETVPTESSQWAVNALDWCAKQGILEGIDATDTTVAATRAQTAQILMNFISKTRQ